MTMYGICIMTNSRMRRCRNDRKDLSTVTKKANLDSEYDLEINPVNYPLLHLDKLSYVRVHKQTTVHKVSLTSLIGDMKTEYVDLYLNVLEKLEEFNKTTLDNAL